MKNKNKQRQKDSELDKIRIGFEITRLNWLSVMAPKKGQEETVTNITPSEALNAAN